MLRNNTAFSKIRKENYEYVQPNRIDRWLTYGPADGLLFAYLNSLGKHKGHMWNCQDVAAVSSSSPASMNNEGRHRLIVFHPPPFVKTNLPTLMGETPYKELANLFRHYNSTHNLLAQEMRLLEEIADAVEVWAILHYRLIDCHYFTNDVCMRQQFNAYIISHLTVSLRASAMLAPMDKNTQEVCHLVSESIANGLGRAQISVTEAAFHAHDMLRGTKLCAPVAEIIPWIEHSEITRVESDPLSWAIQLYNNPYGNKITPPDAAHAKAICALGWLMGTKWVVACGPSDIEKSAYGANFIIA